MKKKYAKGTICYRCGIDKKEAKKYNFMSCSSWGRYFERHLWNKEPMTVNVQIIKIK